MDTFAEMIAAVRADDERAVAELVDQFEPQIRRVVRVRMLNPQLRQVIDSTDVCQSVLAKFFVRARAGEYEFENPEQLKRMLFTMARNKVCDWVRRQTAQRRGAHRVVSMSQVNSGDLADGNHLEPGARCEQQESLEQVHNALPDQERRLADYRAQGESWDAIASREGKSPDALRMQYHRMLRRVARELELHV